MGGDNVAWRKIDLYNAHVAEFNSEWDASSGDASQRYSLWVDQINPITDIWMLLTKGYTEPTKPLDVYQSHWETAKALFNQQSTPKFKRAVEDVISVITRIGKAANRASSRNRRTAGETPNGSLPAAPSTLDVLQAEIDVIFADVDERLA